MKIAENGSWLNETNEGQRFDISLAEAIERFCYDNNLKYMIDLGCGDGSYVNYLSSIGYYAVGYDGNPNVNILSEGTCYTAELHKPLNFIPNDDIPALILSLEVGEHIPAEYESVFIDNVVKYAKRWIILSWAVPGQGGDGHVNCRDNNYIIKKMEERGFIINYKETDKLREQSHLSWFKYTLMVYERIYNSNN